MAIFLKSVMAGLCISIGCITYLSCDNRYIGSALFALGLYTILYYGYSLYTGKVGYVLGMKWEHMRVVGRVYPLVNYLLNTLPVIWVGNLAGTLLGAMLVRFSRISVDATAMVQTKVSDGFGSLLLLGIGCGICMAIAAFSIRDDGLKHPLLVIMPVMVFILCGFEHCVADMFYLAVAPSAWSAADAVRVLLAVTLGNFIGGNIVGLSVRK